MGTYMIVHKTELVKILSVSETFPRMFDFIFEYFLFGGTSNITFIKMVAIKCPTTKKRIKSEDMSTEVNKSNKVIHLDNSWVRQEEK